MTRILKKILLIGLIACVGAVMHPAAVPDSSRDMVYVEKFNRLSQEQRAALIKQLIEQCGSVGMAFNRSIRNNWLWALAPVIEKDANIIYYSYENGQTALHVAVNRGYEKIVEFLLQAGVEKNAVARGGCTALHIAVEQGNVAITELLLQAGVDTEVFFDADGGTALHMAVDSSHEELVCLLLQAGANQDAADTWGRTPLHMAASNGHVAITELLLQAGANKDVVDIKGVSPLYLAIVRGHEQLVNFLVQAGVKVDTIDEQGKTVLAIVLHKRKPENCCALVPLVIERYRGQLAEQYPLRLLTALSEAQLTNLGDLHMLPHEVIEYCIDFLPQKDIQILACASNALREFAYREMNGRFMHVKKDKFAEFINPILRRVRYAQNPQMVALLKQELCRGHESVATAQPNE